MTTSVFGQEPCSLSSPAGEIQVYACSHVSTQQSGELLKILNLVLDNDLDTKAVITKIAEVPKGSAAKAVQLTEKQKENLRAMAKMYPGQKAQIAYIPGDRGATNTANELASLFGSAGWVNPDGSHLSQASEFKPEKPVTGIEVLVNDHDLDERQLPKAAIPLAILLQSMGFARRPTGAAGIPGGAIRVIVGSAQ